MFGGYSYPAGYQAVQVSPWPQRPRAHTGWQAAGNTPPAPQRSNMVVCRTLCVVSASLEGSATFEETYNSLRQPAVSRGTAGDRSQVRAVVWPN